MMRIINRLNIRYIFSVLLFLMILSGAAAEDLITLEEMDREIILNASSRGGTPLLLEFHLQDPSGHVKQVNFDFTGNGITDYAFFLPAVPEEEEGENPPPVYRGIPYRGFGDVHYMKVQLVTEAGSLYRDFEIAFTDFQWGRDNLSFANDNRFRDTAGAVSDYVLDWARSRFGSIDEQQEMLLVSLMYRLFRGNIGRCYGFSALGLYYQAYSWVLGAQYEHAYDLPEKNRDVISLLHMLQNDIVYHVFSAGDISPELDHGPQDLAAEREKILTSIGEGTPLVLGYLSRNTHHSMVAFGYIMDVKQDRLLITAANNWNREQADNMFSKDALMIPLYMKDGTYRVDWLSYTYRDEDRLIVIDPLRPFFHNRESFDFLLEEERQLIISGEKDRVIVEHPLFAYAEDDTGAKRGYDGTRSWWGIPGISLRRFDDIFIFDIPRDLVLTLSVGGGGWNDRQERFKLPNIYFALGHEDKLEIISARGLDIGEDEVMVYELGPSPKDIPPGSVEK